MGAIDLQPYGNLFTTIAQVSFSLAGLLFVALTVSEQSHKRWFAPQNFTFSGLAFLMVVWPGFISLMGLLPGIPCTYLSISAVIFYGFTVVIWLWKSKTAHKGTRAELSRWRWFTSIWDIKSDALVLCLAWATPLFRPAFASAIGVYLVVSVFFSTIAIFSLFRNSTD